jgi:hypothetical protein
MAAGFRVPIGKNLDLRGSILDDLEGMMLRYDCRDGLLRFFPQSSAAVCKRVLALPFRGLRLGSLRAGLEPSRGERKVEATENDKLVIEILEEGTIKTTAEDVGARKPPQRRAVPAPMARLAGG